MHSPFVTSERQADVISSYIARAFGLIQNFIILQKNLVLLGFPTVSPLATQQPIHHLYIFWVLFNYLLQVLPESLKDMSWGLYGSEFRVHDLCNTVQYSVIFFLFTISKLSVL
jgi:hypothetical protein